MSALEYHDRTKHHFHRYARSLGYLDWASQPNPFRRYDGAPLLSLSREPLARDVPFPRLYVGAPTAEMTSETIAEFLRCSLGLSAWKQYGASRWALRVNPSSGNLHPTEGYLVVPLSQVNAGRSAVAPDESRAAAGGDPNPLRSDSPSESRDAALFADGVGVCHYAPREHGLERRCILDREAWHVFAGDAADVAFLVGLTTIHWREAWKYGERAFRYCQHDTGHAIAALRYAAALFGWRLTLLPRWSAADVSAVLGLDAIASRGDAEREEAECLAVVTAGECQPLVEADPRPLLDAARRGVWCGVPNQLSTEHADWPLIDEVAGATRFPGNQPPAVLPGHEPERNRSSGRDPGSTSGSPVPSARSIILQRRSALAFDGRSTLPKVAFISMLRRLQPGAPPCDALWWPPHVHLVLFVHRVVGLLPGIYAYCRDGAAVPDLRSAFREDFLWEPVDGDERLLLLAPLDCRDIAKRLSCDQDIAADGFFALAMLARFEPGLAERGDWLYRYLFWEAGVIGHVLYLEAEAAGARATGIGCYFDDPVHQLLGLSDHAWQSLYHFSVGMPVEDKRLTTEPGYEWES